MVFRFLEKPGPYGVGLSVVRLHDGERCRSLQTLIWYPAERADIAPMTVRDYVDLLATEGGAESLLDEPQMPPSAERWLAGMSPALTTSLWAVRDARAVATRFPVVVYAPGCSNPSWDNADLCEYLASQGYVVIASPSLGATSREMKLDLAGANAQAGDISFLVTRQHCQMRRLP